MLVNASKKFTRLSVHAKEANKRVSAPAPSRGPDEQHTCDSGSSAGGGRGYNKRKAEAIEAGKKKLIAREEEN